MWKWGISLYPEQNMSQIFIISRGFFPLFFLQRCDSATTKQNAWSRQVFRKTLAGPGIKTFKIVRTRHREPILHFPPHSKICITVTLPEVRFLVLENLPLVAEEHHQDTLRLTSHSERNPTLTCKCNVPEHINPNPGRVNKKKDNLSVPAVQQPPTTGTDCTNCD